MYYRDREEAGELLANKLSDYKDQDVVVYALPRGGVITAAVIAKALDATLDLVLVRKIGHPYQPEYAIAAIGESGDVVANEREIAQVDAGWYEQEKKRQQKENTRRRKEYLHGRAPISAAGRTAILVDDGVATGLTLRAGIRELCHLRPDKIIVAVPVIPSTTAEIIREEADELVALEIPSGGAFLGSVGSYYDHFPSVVDDEVIELMDSLREVRSERHVKSEVEY